MLSVLEQFVFSGGGVPQINVHWINVFERIVLLIRYFLFGDERLNKHWIIINQNTNTKCTLSEMLKAQIPWNCIYIDSIFSEVILSFMCLRSYSPAVNVRVTKSSPACPTNHRNGFSFCSRPSLYCVANLAYVELQ